MGGHRFASCAARGDGGPPAPGRGGGEFFPPPPLVSRWTPVQAVCEWIRNPEAFADLHHHVRLVQGVEVEFRDVMVQQVRALCRGMMNARATDGLRAPPA